MTIFRFIFLTPPHSKILLNCQYVCYIDTDDIIALSIKKYIFISNAYCILINKKLLQYSAKNIGITEYYVF